MNMTKKIFKMSLIIFFSILSINAVQIENELLMADVYPTYDIQNADTLKTKIDTFNIKKKNKAKKIKILHRKNLQLQKIILDSPTGDFKDFLDKLAWRESRGNWKVVNRFGYAGKYQIGQAALTELNYKLDVDSFKLNPHIFPEDVQDSLAVELVKLNRRRIKSYIDKYAGKIINEIKVTESGILAATHLLGGGNVRKWLKSRGECCPLDGNGVSIEEYLVLFSNYKININS